MQAFEAELGERADEAVAHGAQGAAQDDDLDVRGFGQCQYGFQSARDDGEPPGRVGGDASRECGAGGACVKEDGALWRQIGAGGVGDGAFRPRGTMGGFADAVFVEGLCGECAAVGAGDFVAGLQAFEVAAYGGFGDGEGGGEVADGGGAVVDEVQEAAVAFAGVGGFCAGAWWFFLVVKRLSCKIFSQ